MKIIFFINGIHPGGKERRMIELMKELKKEKKINFKIVTMNREVHYPEIFEMGVPVNFLIRNTRKDFSIFRKFYKICKEYKPNIIHCWDGMTAVYAIPACKFLKIKLVNGMIVDSPLKQNILNKKWLRAKLSFPFSDIIVGNSKSGLAAYGAPLNKKVCIYNGFNSERLKKIKPKEEIMNELDIRTKYIVGMVATFSKYKDYKTYFNAAELILKKRNDITFLAIGHNTDSPEAEKLISSDFRQHFRLLGNKRNVESYINVLDIGVLSTFTEGVSNSILEYMALCKPVIATNGGGTNEIVIDNHTGFLVKKSNPKMLADKIIKLIDNERLRLRFGLEGEKRIKQIFSIKSMVNSFTYQYNNLTRQNS